MEETRILPTCTAAVALLLAACPAPEEPVCPVGQVQDADTEECVPERCGAEHWGLIERDSDTIHVAPWGDDSWDGSEQWPYRTIQQGADEADGGLVAVAAGDYVENLELGEDHDGVEIAGRCAELTTIDGSGEEAPGVRVTGGRLEVRGVTVTRGDRGVWVEPSESGGTAELQLQDAALIQNAYIGLFILGSGADVRLTRVVVSETRHDEDGTFGRGIDLGDGGQLVGRDLLVEGSHEIGLLATEPGTSVDIEDATVRDTQPRPDGTFGRGIGVQGDASLVARRLLLEGNHDVGLFASSGGTVDIEDGTIRATQPRADGTIGRGLSVQDGASLVARGLLIEGNHDIGLLAMDAGTSVDIEDATIRDTQPLPDGTGGRGISVQDGASLVARAMLLEGNHEVGLLALHSGTGVDLEEVTVRDTWPLPNETLGWGMDIEMGASLVARGLLLEGNHDAGLFVTDGWTTVALEDAIIRDTQPRPDGTGGYGVRVQEGASLVVLGLLLEENHDIGLFAALAGTSVDLEDVVVRDTQPLPGGTGGWGIAVQEGAGLAARGLVLERNRELGLAAWDVGTNVDLEDATIRDTQASPDLGFGRGVNVQDGASLVARGLLLEGNQEAGLAAAQAGTHLDLEGATVRGTQPLSDGSGGRGLCVQGGATLVARDLLVDENHDVGLFATQAGTSVDLEDATIRDTQPRPDGRGGRGISVLAGASLAARDLLLEGNHEVGLSAGHDGTTVDLEDVRITGTRTPQDNAGGMGIIVQADASVTAHGLRVEENEGPALYLVAGGILDTWDASLERNAFAAAVVLSGRLSLHGGVVSGSTFHPGEGGGVGVFAWDDDGPPGVQVEGVDFSDLSGPALYLRGGGRYVARGCEFSDGGAWPLPGGIFAVEGVEPWHELGDTGYFTGLLLEGNTFSDLPSDAILLDSSSATLDLHPETGASNTIGDLDGVPLVWQRCDDVSAPEILDGSMPDPSCEPVPRALGPLLEYNLWLAETEPLE